jgi:phosphatidylinositol alpha-1,6-mannosyltransferase
MAFGIPVVAWDNGWGTAEVLRESKGIVAKPYDVNDFAEKVLALLDDVELHRRIGERSKWYAKSLSWERVGPQFVRLLAASAA